MEELFLKVSEIVAGSVEFIAVLLIAMGAAEAFFKLIWHIFKGHKLFGFKRAIWLSFAQWILLALEFTLAADIVRTAVAPTWESIGQLGAIAFMRTFLSYFLEHDLEMARKNDLKKT